MKWFKHEATAIKDEKIQMLMEQHGAIAYVVYFGICELCAEKLDEKLIPEVTISWVYLERLLHLKRSTIKRLLVSCSAAGLLAAICSDKQVVCSIPNLLKRLDNWTKRSVVTTEQLPTQQEQEQEEEQEVKNKNKNINTPPSAIPLVKHDIKTLVTGVISSKDHRSVSLADIKVGVGDKVLSEPQKHKLFNSVISVLKQRGWATELALDIFKTCASQVGENGYDPKELFPYFSKILGRYVLDNAEILNEQSKKILWG